MRTPVILSLLLSGICSCVLAQPAAPITPLPRVDPDKILARVGTDKPHVLYVNVGKALDEARFREAVAAVSLAMAVNLGVSESAGLDGLKPLRKDFKDKQFSPQAKLVVYVVNDPETVTCLAAAGKWAVINLHGMDQKLPAGDPERYPRRLRQMMMKGLALACGAGANFDARCVMYQGSFTPEGIDQTSVSYSPFASGPIQDMLSKVGGQEIFAPLAE